MSKKLKALKETNYLKERIKIKERLYGIYGESSKFKAIKYMPSVIIPTDSEYYKIGDIVIVLTFNYSTVLEVCIVADENTLVNINTLKIVTLDKYTSYIIGLDRYHYLSKEHQLSNITIFKDYESAYKQLIKDFSKG